MIDFLVHHQNVTIPTNFQCFNPQILMVSPFFRMFSPLFQTPSSFEFFPPFRTIVQPPFRTHLGRPSLWFSSRLATDINWPRLDQEKWTHFTRENGSVAGTNGGFHQLQNRNADFREILRWKIREKWELKHQMVDEPYDNLCDSRGYTWIYLLSTSLNELNGHVQ